MSGIKECKDLLDGDIFETKNVSDFFCSEWIKSEIFETIWINDFLELISDYYKNNNLTPETQKNIEKLSHYYMAKLLYEKKVVDNVEKFATSKKTLKSCFKWKIEDIKLLWISLLPVMFSSIKEHFMGWNSWQDHLDRFSEENFEAILAGAKEWVDTEDLSLLKPSELSNRQFISEIRNALDHSRYVFWSEALYIKNPQNMHHKQEFEKEIPYNFLLLFILNLPHFIPRKSLAIYMSSDNDEIFSNSNDLKFDDFKDNLHIYQYLAKWENIDEATIKNREIALSRYLIWDVWEVLKEQDIVEWGYDKIKMNILEEWWLLTNYFSKEKLDTKHLEYILVSLWMSSLIIPMSILVYLLLIKDNSYKWLKSNELIDDAYNPLYLIFSDYFTSCGVYKQDMESAIKDYHLNTRYDGDIFPNINDEHSLDKQYFMNKLFDKLRTTKQKKNWQSVMKTVIWSWNCLCDYLANCGFKFDWNVFKKWEIEIEFKEVVNLCTFFCDDYFAINWIIGSFPNWLKVQMIKMVYLNELIPIPLQESGKNGKKSERERIRNALAHDNYTILAWVDQIVLRDGYSRSDDKWNRERIYKLSELYESTYKIMDENMKNTKIKVNWGI